METTTAVDFLADQQTLLEEAAQALPHAIDRCSFDKGPLKQPVFSCLTCSDKSLGVPIGVCYACFVQCHTTHDVVELFDRRDFVCDCGTQRTEASGVKCCLQTKSVGAENVTNKYDHCFGNIFCYCKKKYEYEKERENSFMLQCLFCQDWFHDACIINCPDEDSFDEFACRDCVAAHPFLAVYEKVSENMVFIDEKEETIAGTVSSSMTPGRKKRKVDMLYGTPGVNATTTSSTPGGAIGGIVDAACYSDQIQASTTKCQRHQALGSSNPSSSVPQTPSSSSSATISAIPPSAIDPLVCKLDISIVSAPTPTTISPSHLFCFEGWRKELCRCPQCLAFYASNETSHLLIENQDNNEVINSNSSPSSQQHQAQSQSQQSNTVFRPDEDANKSLLDIGMDALNKIPRVKAIEGVRAYERLAQFTKEYLAKFAVEGRVVTKKDIDEMFVELRKQQQVE
ncbi:UNVERIFIED_CONTAM: hypothetical protein HDU68_006984 [Siphonaria sp. JEL0065]|nr:hypothetical protein HDU68_006984 [Siphonaria sp. JEL0065]